MLSNLEKVPRLITILLEASFVLKTINIFVLNNLDFDGFTRSHKNKHERRLAMSKGNKQKKNSDLSADKICSSLNTVGFQSGVGRMMSRNVSRTSHDQQVRFSYQESLSMN